MADGKFPERGKTFSLGEGAPPALPPKELPPTPARLSPPLAESCSQRCQHRQRTLGHHILCRAAHAGSNVTREQRATGETATKHHRVHMQHHKC